MMSRSIHVLFGFILIEFISAIVPYGQTCQAAYTCTFDGKQVANFGWVTAYQAGTVPTGNTCISQLRVCVNGTLSGTYAYASCSVAGSPAAQVYTSCAVPPSTFGNVWYFDPVHGKTQAAGGTGSQTELDPRSGTV
jgi:hypothetical protein